MPGNRAGGLKAAKTNRQRQGKDFYKVIGSMGGKAPSKPKGFAYFKAKGDIEKIAAAGRKGGAIGKRGKAELQEALDNHPSKPWEFE